MTKSELRAANTHSLHLINRRKLDDAEICVCVCVGAICVGIRCANLRLSTFNLHIFTISSFGRIHKCRYNPHDPNSFDAKLKFARKIDAIHCKYSLFDMEMGGGRYAAGDGRLLLCFCLYLPFIVWRLFVFRFWHNWRNCVSMFATATSRTHTHTQRCLVALGNILIFYFALNPINEMNGNKI